MATGSKRPIEAAAKKMIGDASSHSQLRVSQPDMPAPPMSTSTNPAPRPAVSSRLPRVICRRVIHASRTSAIAYVPRGVRIQSSVICSPCSENRRAMITPINVVLLPILPVRVEDA